MKKRVFAWLALVGMLLSALCFPAAADEIRPYPYKQFTTGDAYTEAYTDKEISGRTLWEKKLYFDAFVDLEGYVKGKGEYIEQRARVTLPMLPESAVFGYDYEDETLYVGSESIEGGTRIYINAIEDEMESFAGTVEDWKKKLDVEMSGKTPGNLSWRTSLENEIADPLKITEEEDGSTLMSLHLYDEYENDEGAFGYKEIIWLLRVFRIEGIPNVHFVASAKTCFEIGTGRFFLNDYKPEKHAEKYQGYLDRHFSVKSDYLALNAAEYLTTPSNFVIEWEEPVILKDFEYESVTQNAENTPGEDGGVTVSSEIVEGTGGDSGGVSVPVAVAVSVGGAVAGIAAAAALSGQNGDQKKRKSYKMYVQKDFGDAIRRGGEPVKIRARMAEVSGGKETDRDDLTANIRAAGEGMIIHGTLLAGRYCETTVSVPENNENDTAAIRFIYDGEGGQFTNSVVFRLVDGPSLRFIEEAEPGGGSALLGENWSFDMIPGDGFTYTAAFAVVDAPRAPELADFEADREDGFDVSFEKTGQPAVYRLLVKNHTAPETARGLFAKPRNKTFGFRVKVDGEKEPLTGWIGVTLWPEGLTIDSRAAEEKNGIEYIRVQAYENENAGGLDNPWQVSEMTFTLAVKGEDRTLVDPAGMQFSCEQLRGADGRGAPAEEEENIAEKYRYKVSFSVFNRKHICDFEPNSRLWEPEDGMFFLTVLPIRCTVGAREYRVDVPLRLRGKDIDPMEAWEKEYEKTRERIEKFSLPEQKAYNLEQLEKIAAGDTCRISTWELRLMSKDIVRAYMKFWTEQHSKDQWTANALDWTVWGLEWVKWIGDCAFSYVVAAYTGPLEAIITPAKDVAVNALGEVGVNIVWGTKFDPKKLEIYDQIKNAGDNFVSGGVSDGVSWLASSGMADPAKIKYACTIMGGYFVFAVFNNYLLSLEKGENDFYGAVMAAFKDLTVTALKIAAGMMFKQWLDSPKFKNEIGPKISAFINKKLGEDSALNRFLGKNLGERAKIDLGDQKLSHQYSVVAGNKEYWMKADADIKKAEIVEKYLTELTGAGGAYVHDNPDKTEKAIGFWMKANSLKFSFPLMGSAADPQAENLELTPAMELMVELDLTEILKNTSSALFGWLYDMFFGGLPAAEDVMELPKDPPLPPAKN